MKIINWLFFICIINAGVAQKKQPKAEQPSPSSLRSARKFVREGNKHYKKQEYNKAAIAYQKALDKAPNYRKAIGNLSNTRYQQKQIPIALTGYEHSLKLAKSSAEKANDFHNIGNSLMKQKQYEKAVEAYKQSLINNPTDEETRYNLAYAQLMIKKKKNGGGGGGNKNNKKNKKDKKKQNKKNQNRPNNNNKQNEDKKQQQSQNQAKLNKQERQQILRALKNQERNTRNKVKAQKAKAQKRNQEKDW